MFWQAGFNCLAFLNLKYYFQNSYLSHMIICCSNVFCFYFLNLNDVVGKKEKENSNQLNAKLYTILLDPSATLQVSNV